MDIRERGERKRASWFETSMKLANGKWSEFFENNDHDAPLNEFQTALGAWMLECEDQYIQSLDETTFSAQIGNFQKWVFPVVRSVLPNLISTEIVSVQPLEAPTSAVWYMDIKAGSTKSPINAGDTLISSRTGQQPTGNYSGEPISMELYAAGGSTTNNGVTLYNPIRQYSIVFHATTGSGAVTVTGTDDGNGNIVGVGIASGTVTYANGTIAVTTSDSTDSGSVWVSYSAMLEGSQNIPMVDITLTSVPVTAVPRELRARWSVQAGAQLRSVFGMDIETEMMTGVAETLRYDIDREVMGDLFTIAAQPDSTSHDYWFYTVQPSGSDFAIYKLNLVNVFIAHSNYILGQVKRGGANFIIMGLNVANIVESLPDFESENVSGSGVVFMGTLKNRWRCYKDPYLLDFVPKAGGSYSVPSTVVGADRFLIGLRGNGWTETGYLYCPWIPFYTSPTTILDDGVARKMILSEYATRMVNGLFYSQGYIIHAVKP